MTWIQAGASDQSVTIRVLDSTSGLPASDFNGEAAGLELWYRRDAGTTTDVSGLLLAAEDSSHSDGGLFHLGGGYYRFDLPDAAFSAGVDKVMIGGSATNHVILGQDIQLVGFNPRDLSTLKIDRLLSIDGLATSAALAAAQADLDSIDGLATSAALATVDGNVDAILTDTDELQTNQGNWVAADVNGLATSAALAAAQADLDFIDGLATSAALATVDGNVDAILVDTNELQTNQGNWVAADVNGLATSAALAIAQGDITDILADTDELQGNQGDWLTADVNGLATSAALATAQASLDFIDGLATSAVLATVDGNVDAILVDTNELQTNQGDWVAADVNGLATSAALATVDSNVDAILTDTNELQTNQGNWVAADVNGLATSAALSTAQGNITDILADTNELQGNQGNWLTADVNGLATSAALATAQADLDNIDGLATSAALATVDGNVDAILVDTAFIDGLTTSAVVNMAAIRTQVGDGLSSIGLDHLLSASATAADIATGAFLGQIAADDGNWANFVKEDDSLEAIRNRGDAAWTTGGGGSLDYDGIRQQVTDGLSLIGLDHLLSASATDSDIVTGAFLAQLASSSADWSQFNITEDSLEAIRNRGDVAWLTGAGGALDLDAVRQQVTDGLSLIGLDHLLNASATDSDIVTGAFLAQLASSSADWSQFNMTENSLEAIRDRGDAAWTTGGAGSIDYDGIRQQVTEGLSLIDLDKLLSASATGADVATGAVIAQLAAADGNWATYRMPTDSQDSLRGAINALDGDLSGVDAQVGAILGDTNELQTNQGNWVTADVNGLATSAALLVVNNNVNSILADTSDLQANQGDWATADVDGLATSAVLAVIDGNVDSILAAQDAQATSAVLATLVTDTQAIDGNVDTINAALDGLATSAGLASADTVINTINSALDGLATSSALNDVLIDTSFINGLATSAGLAPIGAQVSNVFNRVLFIDGLSTSAALASVVADTALINGLATSAALNAVDGNVGSIQANLDGLATSAALATIDSVVDAIEVDTQDIQSRLPAALVGGRMDVNVGSIAGSESAASRQADGANLMLPATAVTGTLTTTAMTTDLTENTDDHFNGRTIIWLTGVLQYQATDITDYAGATKTLTYTAVTEAPSNGG
jgi:hypothetical protein